jgi:hypothetical protein
MKKNAQRPLRQGNKRGGQGSQNVNRQNNSNKPKAAGIPNLRDIPPSEQGKTE